HCGKNVRNEQQVMREIADALVHVFVMDSTLARVLDGVKEQGELVLAAECAIARLIVHEGCKAVREHSSEALLGAITGGELELKMAVLARLHSKMESREPVAELRRSLADRVIEAGRYCF